MPISPSFSLLAKSAVPFSQPAKGRKLDQLANAAGRRTQSGCVSRPKTLRAVLRPPPRAPPARDLLSPLCLNKMHSFGESYNESRCCYAKCHFRYNWDQRSRERRCDFRAVDEGCGVRFQRDPYRYERGRDHINQDSRQARGTPVPIRATAVLSEMYLAATRNHQPADRRTLSRSTSVRLDER